MLRISAWQLEIGMRVKFPLLTCEFPRGVRKSYVIRIREPKNTVIVLGHCKPDINGLITCITTVITPVGRLKKKVITPFATIMKAYLVVVTVTLGEVFACQLKKFHNLLELPCWMRGPENFGTFEGNQ